MKKWFMLLALVTMPVFAAVQVDTSGLTDAQKATLVQQAEQMKAEVQSPEGVAETVDKWVNVGERFGKMMGGAAKEVGMAANDFLQTPVGMLTAGLIIFNYVGGPIIHVTLGLLIFFTGIVILLYFQRKASKFVIKYDVTKPRWYGYAIESKTRDRLDGEIGAWLSVGYALVFIVSIWTMFAW